MPSPTPQKQLIAEAITPERFQPFGQVIYATEDGTPYSSQDAQLQLDCGVPRFYIMRLHRKGRHFSRITRHQRCTQCLGALEGKSWLIAVAPPSSQPQPALDAIQAFQVPGNCFIKLHVGTWHAGPYFDADTIDFYNLELSDTNVIDHDTCDLWATYNTEVEIC
ncbi:MAG: ureidoglycolate lyase [Synechococcales cyanobacterium T60_A2020_003]|nr:ureidoglycolate lyase [Synechococcales cyanobacterium T60_A2020_003]